MRTPDISFILAGLLLCLSWNGPAPLAAETSAPPASRIQSATERVVVPVMVFSGPDDFLTGLRREDFQLFVDRKEIKDFQFLHNLDLPVQATVVFDHSSSQLMSRLGWIKAFIHGLIHDFNYEDLFSLATFGYQYAVLQAPTTDRYQISELLTNLHPRMFASERSIWEYFKRDVRTLSQTLDEGGPPPNKTAIALDHSLSELSRSELPKKILILISDGDENLSGITMDHVRPWGIPVYAVYFPGSGIGARSLLRRGEILEKLTSESGGKLFQISSVIEPEPIGRKIAFLVRNQYLISFEPGSELSRAKTHPLKVSVRRPEVRIDFRKSFRFTHE